MNNIRQQGSYGIQSVLIAKEIALERKLITPENINTFDSDDVRGRMMTKLTDLGYSPQIATQVARQKVTGNQYNHTASAISSHSNYSNNNYSNTNDDSGIGITGVIVIILFVIKLMLLFARMH